MKAKLFLLLAGLFFYASLSGQEPVITFETDSLVGKILSIKLRLETAGNVDIDWGNGTKTTYAVAAHPSSTTVSAALQGSIVKFYNDQLRYFECKSAGITSLDVSRTALLDVLYIDNNLLTSLDLSANPNLRLFALSGNPISSIDLTNKPLLTTIYLTNNYFSACALDSVYRALPTKTGTLKINISGNPGAETSNTSIATAKGWTVNVTGDGTGCFTSSNRNVNENVVSVILKDNILSFDRNVIGSISMIDITGKIVLRKDKVNSLIVSGMAKGLYLVRYNVLGVTETRKIVIQ